MVLPLLHGAAHPAGGCPPNQTMEGHPAAHCTDQVALRARRPDVSPAAAASFASLGLRQPQDLKRGRNGRIADNPIVFSPEHVSTFADRSLRHRFCWISLRAPLTSPTLCDWRAAISIYLFATGFPADYLCVVRRKRAFRANVCASPRAIVF